MQKRAVVLSSLLAAVRAQQVGTLEQEVHPRMTWQRCNADGSCTTVNGQVVLDSNWRWVHNVDGYANCYDGNKWVTEHCSDPEQCAQNCALEGANYQSTYGVTVSGDSMTLRFVTNNANGKNVGSRLYLMEDEDNYEMFHLLNREFTMDVDSSQLECGLNGAVYFVSMEKDGGKSSYSGNKAGARYGTGYCDSQCPRDIKFIGGKANVEGWNPSDSDANGGVGNMGTCCPEMDIWEANRISTAYTPHPCDDDHPTICNGDTCGGTYSGERYAGTCDPDGCDFNSYRQGNRSFYGPGMIVDTNQKITVVTQFLTHDGTDNGRLSEIKRFYVQNGVVIPNSESTIAGVPGNSITEEYCNVQKQVFGDNDVFTQHGDLVGMGNNMRQGMVLALSLWGDHYSRMLWLDSTYPTDADPNVPGNARGTCPTDSGAPDEIEAQYPNAEVTYSNIKFGPIGSTFNSNGGNPNPNPTTSASNPPTSSAAGGTAARWGQCGGNNWTGPTQCESGTTCTVINEWYHQCL